MLLVVCAEASFDRFVWSMENVRSRAFEGPYEGSSYETRQKLFVAAGALSLGIPIVRQLYTLCLNSGSNLMLVYRLRLH